MSIAGFRVQGSGRPALRADENGRHAAPGDPRQPRRWIELLLLCTTLAFLTGCAYITAGAYLFGPKRTQKPEFTFTPSGRIAVVIENAKPAQENPLFTRELHRRLVEIFKERKVSTNVVPLDDVYRLRQENPDFPRWSLSKVARELGAEQLLYIRVERLQLREAPNHPMMTPIAELKLKVIAAEPAAEKARLWPGDLEERALTVTRPPSEASDPIAIDTATTKLAREAARRVAYYFYEVDLEEPTPPEP
jgi:hypothetical protein